MPLHRSTFHPFFPDHVIVPSHPISSTRSTSAEWLSHQGQQHFLHYGSLGPAQLSLPAREVSLLLFRHHLLHTPHRKRPQHERDLSAPHLKLHRHQQSQMPSVVDANRLVVAARRCLRPLTSGFSPMHVYTSSPSPVWVPTGLATHLSPSTLRSTHHHPFDKALSLKSGSYTRAILRNGPSVRCQKSSRSVCRGWKPSCG